MAAGTTTKRDQIKKEVVAGIDFISPLRLSEYDPVAVEAVKLNYTSGFDDAMRKALHVPLTIIAFKYGEGKSRAISHVEASSLKTIADAIDLTLAASEGKEYEAK